MRATTTKKKDMSHSLPLPVIICILFVFILQGSHAQPTTPFIQQVFLGRCYEKNPAQDKSMDCGSLWSAFANGAMMDMNMVTDANFSAFYSQANFSTPADNALFWSGTKDFASRMSNDGSYFTTLEETSTGYILNGLNWCGKTYVKGVPPSFDYTNSCNFSGSGSYYGNYGVWKEASHLFASTAVGKINVLLQPQQLNYNSGPYIAYRNTSIFATIELPSMNVSRISHIRVLLLVDKVHAPNERCGHGSLAQLNSDVYKKFRFHIECVDDPKDILAILCADGNTSPECVLSSDCDKPENDDSSSSDHHLPSPSAVFMWAAIASSFAALFLVVVVVLSVNVMKMRRQQKYGAYSPVIGASGAAEPLLSSRMAY